MDPEFKPTSKWNQFELPSTLTLEGLFEAASKARPVQSTNSKDEGFYGWMLEVAYNGTLTKFTYLMNDGVELLRKYQP
jgi:hypothetical protein